MAPRAWSSLYDDFNVAAKQRQELHKAFRRKTGKLPTQQAGNLWLIDLQEACCTSLSEPPGANNSGNAKCKSSFSETLF